MRTALRIALPLIVALIPLLPLISTPSRAFYPGWSEGVSMVGHFAEHFERRGEFPLALHLNEGIGFPHPLFDQPLMLPLLGLMASKLGAIAAIFLFAYVALAFAFAGIRSCLRPFHLGDWDNAFAAALVWFFFPLTQFYSGRFAEATATTLLFAGLAFWDLFARAPKEPFAKAAAAICWLCFTVMAGSYPGGLLYSLGTIGIVVFTSFWISKNWVQALMGGIGVLAGILAALGPWIYTMSHFSVWDKSPAPRDLYAFAVILVFFVGLVIVQVRNLHPPKRPGRILSGVILIVAFAHTVFTLLQLPRETNFEVTKRIDEKRYQFPKAYLEKPHPEWVGLPLVKAEFRTTDGSEFGSIAPLKLQLEQSSLIQTNVVAFPWNQILVEQIALEPENALIKNNRIYFALPPGSHRVEYGYRTPPEWRLLKQISQCAFAIGFFLIWFLSVKATLSAEKS